MWLKYIVNLSRSPCTTEHGPLSFPGTPSAALSCHHGNCILLENFVLPANSSTNSLTGAKLDSTGSNTEVETEKEEHPRGIEVGKEEAEPDEADRDVGEEEGDADQEADGPSSLSLVVTKGGDEQVGQGNSGSNALKAVLIEVSVKHGHVHLTIGF